MRYVVLHDVHAFPFPEKKGHHYLASSGENPSPPCELTISEGKLSASSDLSEVSSIIALSACNNFTIVSLENGYLVHEHNYPEFSGDERDMLVHEEDLVAFLTSALLSKAA